MVVITTPKKGVPKSTKSADELNAQYRKAVNASVRRIRVSASRLEKKLKSRKYHLTPEEKEKVVEACFRALEPLREVIQPKTTSSEDVI